MSQETHAIVRIRWVESDEREDYIANGYYHSQEEANEIATNTNGNPGDILVICGIEDVVDLKRRCSHIYIVDSHGKSIQVPEVPRFLNSRNGNCDNWFGAHECYYNVGEKLIFANIFGMNEISLLEIIYKCVCACEYRDDSGILSKSMSLLGRACKNDFDSNAAGKLRHKLYTEINDLSLFGLDAYRIAYNICGFICRMSDVESLIDAAVICRTNRKREMNEIVCAAMPLRKMLKMAAESLRNKNGK